MTFRRETLTKTRISTFEKIQKFEFVNYYNLTIEYERENAKAKKKIKSTKQKLRLTKKRLKIAESNDLRERIKKAIWVELFLKKFESAQMRLNELQDLTENVKCELKSYSRWWQARQMKWDEFSEEEKRKIRLERESAKFRDQDYKYDELRKKKYEAEFARHKTKKEMKFAKQELKIAQLNNLREIVERVVMIKMTQKEIRFAQTQFEKKRRVDKKNWAQKKSNKRTKFDIVYKREDEPI